MSQTYEFACPSCDALIQEKTLRPGQLKRCRACHQRVVIPSPPEPPPDATPYGSTLAERVMEYLEAGGEIPPRHPYFYGVCLAKIGGEFLYGYGAEAGVAAFQESSAVLRRFPDRGGFVSWLAAQSDVTMGTEEGADRAVEGWITRRTLQSALRLPRDWRGTPALYCTFIHARKAFQCASSRPQREDDRATIVRRVVGWAASVVKTPLGEEWYVGVLACHRYGTAIGPHQGA